MQSINESAAAFLASKRVAVTGVSCTPKARGSSNVNERPRERGYKMFAVNPNAGQVEGIGATGIWRRSPAGCRRW